MFFRLLLPCILLFFVVVVNYQLWFRAVKSDEIIEYYSNPKNKRFGFPSDFMLRMIKSGVAIWLARLAFLAIGILLTSDIIQSLTH
jgi:hypothetical protein